MTLNNIKSRFNALCGRVAIMPFISKRYESDLETFSNTRGLYYGRAVEIILSRKGVPNPDLYNSRYHKQGGLELFDHADLDGKKIYTLRYNDAEVMNVVFPRRSYNQHTGPVYVTNLSPDKAWRRELMALYDQSIAPRPAACPAVPQQSL